tara:strand:+ start:467 stop:784 length:318 start_codon:yes stop_codon:yes gene_type:complete
MGLEGVGGGSRGRLSADDTIKIARAIEDPDRWAIRITYIRSDNKTTNRIVSPVRYYKANLQALCLGREQMRNFALDGILSVELVDARDCLMPEPIEKWPSPDSGK